MLPTLVWLVASSGGGFLLWGMDMLNVLRSLVGVVIIAAVLLAAPAVYGQNHKSKNKKDLSGEQTEAAKREVARWLSLLTQLQAETKTLPPEKSRVFALAEIADAYWQLNQDKSRECFNEAVALIFADRLPLADEVKALNYVVSLAAKRDLKLAKALLQDATKIIAHEEKSDAVAISVASGLLKTDPTRAAELVELNVPSGLNSDAAGFFILRLASENITLANRTYAAYLNQAAGANLPLHKLLWLGGYAFGLGETYSLNMAQLNLIGTGGKSIAGLAPNPALFNPYIDLVSRSLSLTLSQLPTLPPEQQPAVRSTAFFSIVYLSPLVKRYSSERLPAWQSLEQRVVAVCTPAEQQKIAANAQIIEMFRRSAQTASTSSNENQVEELLSQAKEAKRECEQDAIHAEAALKSSYAKNFLKAQRVADQIKDIALKEGVMQFLLYDMATAALESGDLIEAKRLADKLSDKEIRSLAFVAQAVYAKSRKDNSLLLDSVSEVRRSIESLTDPQQKASLLLVVANLLAEAKSSDAMPRLWEAVKAYNNLNSSLTEVQPVWRKLEFGCDDNEKTLYGGTINVKTYSLLETFATFGKFNGEEALLAAESISDKQARIRSKVALINVLGGKSKLSAEPAKAD